MIITLFGVFSILIISTTVVKNVEILLKKLQADGRPFSQRLEITDIGDSQDDIMRKTAVFALTSHLDNTIQNLTEKIRHFQEDGNDSMVFENVDMIKRTPLELLKLLPNGSVWCGISRISESNWNDSILHDFVAVSRESCRQGKLMMYRVYATRGEELPVSESMIRDDQRMNVNLKQYIIPEGDEKGPEDVSLVWKPFNPEIEHNENSIPPNEARFKRVGALAFEIDRQNSLAKVTLYPARSVAFKNYLVRFERCWQGGRDIP